MQYTAPPTQNVTTAPTTVSTDSGSAATLFDDHVDFNVRTLRLQMYLDRVIRQNTKAGVTTDVSVVDLSNNQTIKSYSSDTQQFAASVNKLPIARLVLNDIQSGKLKTDTVLTWGDADIRAGAGIYDQPGAPKQATVQQLLFDMLNPSGNTAVRVLVNQGMGGSATVNQRFSNELGLHDTALQPQGGNTFYLGNTTAREALQSMQALLSGSDSETAYIKNALATNIYTDYGVRSQLAGNDYIVLANKVGILDDVDGNNRHDVGLIYNTTTGKTYGYAFLNTAHGEAYNTATSQAGVSVADMGRGVLRYGGDKQQKTERAFNDAPRRVEQRVRY